MPKHDEDVAQFLKGRKTGFRVVESETPPQGSPDATTPELPSTSSSLRPDAGLDDAKSNPVADAVSRYFGSGRKGDLSNGPVAPASDDDLVMFSVRPARDPRTDEPADAKVEVYSKSKKKVILTQG